MDADSHWFVDPDAPLANAELTPLDVDVSSRRLCRLPVLASCARALYAHSNRITHVPPSLQDLGQLEILWLGNNPLEAAPVALPRGLRKLDLTNTGLQRLPRPGWGCALSELWLGHNRLTAWPRALCLATLECVWLNHNELHALPTEMTRMTALRSLTLSANPLPDSLQVDVVNNAAAARALVLHVAREFEHHDRCRRAALLMLRVDVVALPAEMAVALGRTVWETRNDAAWK